MRRVAGIFLTLVCLAPGTALADAQFTAEDIIKHFAKGETAANTPVPPRAAETAAVRPGTDDDMILPLTGVRRGVSLGGGSSDLNLMITFESGSDRLTVQAQRNLDAFATALRDPALAAFSFEVEGHTDAKGSDRFNLELSQRRAESVVAYLVARGIAGGRLRARGYGETRPVMDDPEHPQNRRVVTRLIR